MTDTPLTSRSRPPEPREPIAFAPWPHFAEDEIEAVARVLRSGRVNYWTGTEARSFEAEYAEATRRKHGIAVANGTLALALALNAFGVGAGDEVVTASRTFIASASAAVMRGATPVVADVDRDSQNLTAETIAVSLTPRTRALVVVHLGGRPCDMAPIMDLARAHDLIVVEDCAQAHGATVDGKPVGSFGHAAAFSFCQDKIVTTGGEGGMLVLDDDEAWKRAWAYKDHGKSHQAVYQQDHPPGFRWLHESFGTNWRLTEPQAAIGRVQLGKLEGWVAARNRHAAVLSDGFARLPALRLPPVPASVRHSYYRFYAFLEPAALRSGWDRNRILTEVEEAGIPCSSGSCSEIYRELAFVRGELGPTAPLPVASELGHTSLAFLVHPTLSDDALGFTVDVVSEATARATR